MANATTNRPGPISLDPVFIERGLAASTKIPKGCLAAVSGADAAGNAVNWADTADYRPLGVAKEMYDNSGGSANDIVGAFYRKGTFSFVASNAAQSWVGQLAYATDNQTVQITPTKHMPAIGVISKFVSSTEVWVDVDFDQAPRNIVSANTAASAAVTNTNSETAFNKNYQIPANKLKAGSVIRILAQGIATSTNSTDTLTIKLKLGTDILVATAAVDVANDDVFVLESTAVIRTDGASGTYVAAGKWALGAEGTATFRPDILGETAIDTTAAQTVSATATWSVANAGNSCRLDILTVEVFDPER